MREPAATSTFDVLVIGAGFGGLGAALSLAEQGARVCLCESLRYPGGCASTFQRGGFRFDAGATLLSGLGRGQLFGSWLERYAPHTQVDWMDPLVELRSPGLRLVVGRDRAALVAQFCAMPGAPIAKIRAFFARQQAVAALLWSVFDDVELLPPFGVKNLARHSVRLLRYATLAPLLGRSLASVLASYGLSEFEPLRLYIDALCQITVQCPAAEAEALFALAAMDYYYRGTAHVRGGVGTLANVLLRAAAEIGVEVRLPARVSDLRRDSHGFWLAATRRGPVRARAVVANLIPAALEGLLAKEPRHLHGRAELRARSAAFDDSWGAAMLYAVARAPHGASADAHHLQLIAEPEQRLSEGNHVFLSASSELETERAPTGRRTLTISTHVSLAKLRAAGDAAGQHVRSIQCRMRRTLELRAPEWSGGIEHELSASPRTFARFVGRPSGTVGGLPRRVGMSSYAGIGPSQVLDGIWLVGDSVFPGQSALATAIGGVRTASDVRRSLGG